MTSPFCSAESAADEPATVPSTTTIPTPSLLFATSRAAPRCRAPRFGVSTILSTEISVP